MKKYRVVGSTKEEFLNIEMKIVFDDDRIGTNCSLFGTEFVITQTGKAMILSSKDWVLSLLELPELNVDLWQKTLVDPKDLRFNLEIDIFIEKKTIRIQTTDRLKEEHGVTLECIYKCLKNEWKFISSLSNTPFPFEYKLDDLLFIMRDSWNFDSLKSISLTREGSFSRYNSEGRCI